MGFCEGFKADLHKVEGCETVEYQACCHVKLSDEEKNDIWEKIGYCMDIFDITYQSAFKDANSCLKRNVLAERMLEKFRKCQGKLNESVYLIETYLAAEKTDEIERAKEMSKYKFKVNEDKKDTFIHLNNKVRGIQVLFQEMRDILTKKEYADAEGLFEDAESCIDHILILWVEANSERIAVSSEEPAPVADPQ